MNTNPVPDGVLAIRSGDAVLKLDVMKRKCSDVQQKCHSEDAMINGENAQGGTPADGNAHGETPARSSNATVRYWCDLQMSWRGRHDEH